MKYHLNPKKLHLSVGFAYEESGARKNIVFDKANPEHDVPEAAVKRLKEIHQGKTADLLPGPVENEEAISRPPTPAKPNKGASPPKDEEEDEKEGDEEPKIPPAPPKGGKPGGK